MMTKSRMEQENYYHQMMPQNPSIYEQYENNQPMRQSHLRQNNENLSPYLSDEAYRSQLYEMRR